MEVARTVMKPSSSSDPTTGFFIIMRVGVTVRMRMAPLPMTVPMVGVPMGMAPVTMPVPMSMIVAMPMLVSKDKDQCLQGYGVAGGSLFFLKYIVTVTGKMDQNGWKRTRLKTTPMMAIIIIKNPSIGSAVPWNQPGLSCRQVILVGDWLFCFRYV